MDRILVIEFGVYGHVASYLQHINQHNECADYLIHKNVDWCCPNKTYYFEEIQELEMFVRSYDKLFFLNFWAAISWINKYNLWRKVKISGLIMRAPGYYSYYKRIPRAVFLSILSLTNRVENIVHLSSIWNPLKVRNKFYDFPMYSPSYSNEKKFFDIGFFGNLSGYKRIDIFLERYETQIIRNRLRIIVAGRISDSNLNYLNKKKFKNLTIIRGFLSEDDLRRKMMETRLIVVTNSNIRFPSGFILNCICSGLNLAIPYEKNIYKFVAHEGIHVKFWDRPDFHLLDAVHSEVKVKPSLCEYNFEWILCKNK